MEQFLNVLNPNGPARLTEIKVGSAAECLTPEVLCERQQKTDRLVVAVSRTAGSGDDQSFCPRSARSSQDPVHIRASNHLNKTSSYSTPLQPYFTLET